MRGKSVGRISQGFLAAFAVAALVAAVVADFRHLDGKVTLSLISTALFLAIVAVFAPYVVGLVISKRGLELKIRQGEAQAEKGQKVPAARAIQAAEGTLSATVEARGEGEVTSRSTSPLRVELTEQAAKSLRKLDTGPRHAAIFALSNLGGDPEFLTSGGRDYYARQLGHDGVRIVYRRADEASEYMFLVIAIEQDKRRNQNS